VTCRQIISEDEVPGSRKNTLATVMILGGIHATLATGRYK
jgi:hypothetical protein